MKSNLFLFCFLFCFFLSNSQNNSENLPYQKGLVREFNSNKKPLEGVAINFFSALSTDSDIDGKFKIVFTKSKKLGDPITPESVYKSGYEVVNEKELNILSFSSTNSLRTDIILAKTGVVRKAKLEYADASYNALLKGYEEQKYLLSAQIKESKINEEYYRKSLKELFERFERQQNQLDELADTFARINFDDYGPEYKQALELYKNGEIDDAIKLMESLDLDKQIEDLINETKRIDTAKKQIRKDEENLKLEKAKTMEMLVSLVDMYHLNLNSKKAEKVFDNLLQLDSTDLFLLRKAADFFDNVHLNDKALGIYEMIIKNESAQIWDIAQASSRQGDILTRLGYLEMAKNKYKKALYLFKKLSKETENLYLDLNISISNQFLGDVFYQKNLLDSSFFYYQKFISQITKLKLRYPKEEKIINVYGIANSKMALISQKKGNHKKALEYLIEFNQIQSKLNQKFPNNRSFKKGLAASNEYLGTAYENIGQLDSALIFYINARKINHKIITEKYVNPNDEFSLLIVNQKIGNLYEELAKKRKNMVLFDKAYFNNLENLKIAEELYNKFPQNANFANLLAITYQNLGTIQDKRGKGEESYNYFLKFRNLSNQIYNEHSENTEYKKNFAYANQFLGGIQLNRANLDSALVYYKLNLKLHQEIQKEFPKIPELTLNLSKANSNLALVLIRLGDIYDARDYLLESKILSNNLYEALPNSLDAKENYAKALVDLGSLFYAKEPRISLEYLENGINLYKELSISFPKNEIYREKINLSKSFISMIPTETNKAKEILKKLKTSPKNSIRYDLYNTLLKIHENQNEGNQFITYSKHALSWYALLNGDFQKAEKLARDIMKISPFYKYPNTNLAPALLLQGKKKDALIEYKKWASKPFKEQGLPYYKNIFLADLKEFQKAGAIPVERKKDVEEVIAWLKSLNP